MKNQPPKPLKNSPMVRRWVKKSTSIALTNALFGINQLGFDKAQKISLVEYLVRVRMGEIISENSMTRANIYFPQSTYNKLINFLIESNVIELDTSSVDKVYRFISAFNLGLDKEEEEIFNNTILNEEIGRKLSHALMVGEALPVFMADVIGSSKMVHDPEMESIYDDCYQKLNHCIKNLLTGPHGSNGMNLGGTKGDDCQIILESNESAYEFMLDLYKSMAEFFTEKSFDDERYLDFKFRAIVTPVQGTNILRKDIQGRWVLFNSDPIIELARLLERTQGNPLNEVPFKNCFSVFFSSWDIFKESTSTFVAPTDTTLEYPPLQGNYFYVRYDGKIKKFELVEEV